MQCQIDIESNAKWPLQGDLSEVIKQTQALEEMDKEREAQQEQLKKEEREKQKEGSADDMTVRLLREVLDETGLILLLLFVKWNKISWQSVCEKMWYEVPFSSACRLWNGETNR